MAVLPGNHKITQTLGVCLNLPRRNLHPVMSVAVLVAQSYLCGLLVPGRAPPSWSEFTSEASLLPRGGGAEDWSQGPTS